TPEQNAAYEKKRSEIEARLKPLREEIHRIEQPYRDILLPEKYKEFPENVQTAIRTPEAQRTPGQVLLAAQVIRTTDVSGKEIDRIMRPGELARKRSLAEKSGAS